MPERNQPHRRPYRIGAYFVNIRAYTQQALVNILAAKLRSFLAVLGILVGTAAVVALISCGQLATEKALEQFKALGTDLMAVSVFPKSSDKSHTSGDRLTLEQWRNMAEHIPGVEQIAAYSSVYQPISFNGKIIQGVIIGADDYLADILKIQLAKGHFISLFSSFEHHAVIGNKIAKQIRSVTLDEPLGKQIRIGSTLYTIIGIAKAWKENAFFNEDINQSVMIPIAGMPLVQKDKQISNAVLKLENNSEIDDIIEQFKMILNLQAPKLNVFPRSARQIIASMENQGRIFTLLLGVIGGISLLVGGIGVMNVMLVSVSERRKEIGIRKAVGARNKEIQALFLTESVILGLLGGSLGVISGLLLTWIIAYFSHWPFYFYIMPPLAGFAVSVCTGVFFGFYPARRASKLEPIISLRSE